MNQTRPNEPMANESPLPPAIPSVQSDQEYLRMLESQIAVCVVAKQKLSLLIEYCDTGLTIIEERAVEPEDIEKCRELRKKFQDTPKTPSLTSNFLASDSDNGKGMSYSILVPKGSQSNSSSLMSAPQDHYIDLQVALDLSYEVICAPFINLKMEIRAMLKKLGIITTYDIIGTLNERIKMLSEMTEREREMMMGYFTPIPEKEDKPYDRRE